MEGLHNDLAAAAFQYHIQVTHQAIGDLPGKQGKRVSVGNGLYRRLFLPL